MTETFEVNGVDVVVEYNDLLYSSADVRKMLKAGAKSRAKFDEIQSEIEVRNCADVVDKLFRAGAAIEKAVDLTSYLPLLPALGKPLDVVLKNTFGLEVAERKEGNVYLLRGPKKGFADLERMLRLFGML